MTTVHFGYPWWLSYGHLVLAAILFGVWMLARALRWPKVLVVAIAAITLWSFAAFIAARFVLNLNGPAAMPTERFLTSGPARVLDMGAGTGRSTLMVLESRPQTHVVALDLFGDSYRAHFGKGDNGEQRLRDNLRAAGVDTRATIQAGDMKSLPFEAATFDAIVSSYAIDHLGRTGIPQALHEAFRVAKPGAEFLLMVIGKDPWLTFTFGPLLMHGGTRGAQWWTAQLREAGFEPVEEGMRPGTLYVLSRKR